MTDHTPVVGSRRMSFRDPSSSSLTDCAVGAQTDSVGRPLWKAGPSSAFVAAGYRSSSTPAIWTPVAVSTAPLAARWEATS